LIFSSQNKTTANLYDEGHANTRIAQGESSVYYCRAEINRNGQPGILRVAFARPAIAKTAQMNNRQ
jgi:hypothetical protein